MPCNTAAPCGYTHGLSLKVHAHTSAVQRLHLKAASLHGALTGEGRLQGGAVGWPGRVPLPQGLPGLWALGQLCAALRAHGYGLR